MKSRLFRPAAAVAAAVASLLLSSSAFAQILPPPPECPSGDPLNCHPGFESCQLDLAGNLELIPLVSETGATIASASLQIQNSPTELNLYLTANGGWQLEKVYAHVAADASGIPSDPNAYSLVITVPAPLRATANMNLAMFSGSCGSVSVVADVQRRNFFTGVTVRDRVVLAGGPNAYCTMCCEMAAGKFRTQTQGGWGSTANGNNPGTYRDANFAAAFPTGLVAGCTRTLTLTSSAAVEAFLPAGGPPRALASSWIDPTRSQLKNVLAGQVTALGLTLGFDAADPTFSSSRYPIGSLELAEGPLAGLTVQEVFDEASLALGGCVSAYSLADLNAAVSSINENFVDGTELGDALVCPAGQSAN